MFAWQDATTTPNKTGLEPTHPHQRFSSKLKYNDSFLSRSFRCVTSNSPQSRVE
jgi:hypothetical protein